MRAGICLLAAALLGRAPVQQPAELAVFQEAIELGRNGDPGPYTLHMNAAGTGVAGAVYTPFVRVAMASHAAHLQGQELAATELPAWLTEPVIYFALRWYCVDTDCALPREPVNVVVLQPRSLKPLWVSRNFETLRRFGAPVPSPDTIAVAAFPANTLTPGSLVRTCAAPDDFECRGRAGVITARDLAQWK